MFGRDGRLLRPFSSLPDWITVVGLEIHAQIASKRKLFSSSTNWHDAQINSLVDSFDWAAPGFLPILNEECLNLALRAATLLKCKIRELCSFDRKHYLYPDLPHGYQITQYHEPYAENGHVWIKEFDKSIPIERIQMEMDSGKTFDMDGCRQVDLNRAGVGLLEIVTAPVFRSSAEVVLFSKKVQQILRHAKVCRGDLEAGSFRIDANISVTGPLAPKEAGPLGTRVEIKNINSFGYLARAIEAEARRQIKVLETGKLVKQETRGFNPVKNQSFKQRSKESGLDYRFTREFDIPTVHVGPELLQRVKDEMPMMIEEQEIALMSKFGLSQDQSTVLVENEYLLQLFTDIIATRSLSSSLVFHWLTIDYAGALNAAGLEYTSSKISIEQIGEVLSLIEADLIPRNRSRELLELLLQNPYSSAIQLAREHSMLLSTMDHDVVDFKCRKILEQFDQQAQEIAEGKRSIDFLMGPAMKALKGKAKPQDVRKCLLKHLQIAFPNLAVTE